MKTHVTTTKRGPLKTLVLGVFLVMGFLFTETLHAQSESMTVTGLVTSNDGPVFGATVLLKGTRVGVISNADGEFTFPQELKENDVLVVSFFGYKTKEITISGDTTHVKPFLEDEPIIVVAALRMEDDTPTTGSHN
ncbi:MAG: carboxypeptidase-like regulatory domain-containing protein [Flavobacteriaceae bacterium]|nr:carboxypeptidase-like regulatory domain-containing protein [Flavobacteriaceae bacterium]